MSAHLHSQHAGHSETSVGCHHDDNRLGPCLVIGLCLLASSPAFHTVGVKNVTLPTTNIATACRSYYVTSYHKRQVCTKANSQGCKSCLEDANHAFTTCQPAAFFEQHRQGAIICMVADSNQQMYRWRGAQNSCANDGFIVWNP